MPRTGEDVATYQDQEQEAGESVEAGPGATAPRPEASAAGLPGLAERSHWERAKFAGGNVLKAIIVDPVGMLKEASRLLLN